MKKKIDNSQTSHQSGIQAKFKVELTKEELDLLLDILVWMKDRNDWIKREYSNGMSAMVILDKCGSVPIMVNNIYKKLSEN